MLTLTRLISWRYLRRRTLRMIMAVVSIALGVATLIASQVLLRTTFSAMETTSAQLAGLADIQISNGELGVDLGLLKEIRAVPGVAHAAPLVAERVLISPPEGPSRRALLLGAQPGAEEQIRSYGSSLDEQLQLDPSFLTDLSFLTNPGPVVAVGQGLKNVLPDKTKWVSVHTPSGLKRVWIGGTLKMEGAAAAIGGNVIAMELEPALDLLGRRQTGDKSENRPDGIVSRIDVVLHEGAKGTEVQDALNLLLAGRATAQPPQIRDQGMEDVLAGIQIGLTVGATMALFVGMFLVYNSLAVTVAERRHEIGIIRALGGTRGQVRGLFAVEAVILGLIGSALGLIGGIGLAQLSLGTVERILREQFTSLELSSLTVPPGLLLLGMLAGVGASLVASIAPAGAAAAEPPSDALRHVPIQLGHWKNWRPIVMSVCFAILAFLVFASRENLPARIGNVGFICLMSVAFMFATPFLAWAGVSVLHPIISRVFGISGRLAVDDLSRSPARTGLTIGALSLGLAMTMETAGTLRSTEEPLFEWLDEAVKADLFISSGAAITGGGEQSPLESRIGIDLAREEGIEDVLPVRMLHLDYGETRVLLFSIPIDMYRRHHDEYVTAGESDAWATMEQPGQHIVISDNFAALHKVGPGDEITLPTPRGPAQWKILGTIPEYSWVRGSIVMNSDTFRGSYNDDLVDAFDIFLKDGADAEAVRTGIHERLGAEHDLVILTRREFQDHIRGMIDQFYILFNANAFMALTVSFLGIANTLAISVLHRRREIGLLRSIGATRRQIAASVAVQAFVLAILGILIGISLGSALEKFVLSYLMVEEAGYVFGFLFPTVMAMIAIGFTMIAAQVAAALPALRAATQPISEAIAYE